MEIFRGDKDPELVCHYICAASSELFSLISQPSPQLESFLQGKSFVRL